MVGYGLGVIISLIMGKSEPVPPTQCDVPTAWDKAQDKKNSSIEENEDA